MKRITFELDYNCYYPIKELTEYLRGLDGINSVSYNYDGVCPVIDVKYDGTKINYKTIFYETCAFCEEPYDGSILSFDQHLNNNKEYEINLDNICCEMCYKGVISELINTEGITSIKGCSDKIYKDQRDKVRVKVKYDDSIIKESQIKELENKIRSDLC